MKAIPRAQHPALAQQVSDTLSEMNPPRRGGGQAASCGREQRAAELMEQRTEALTKIAQCMETPTLETNKFSAFDAVVSGDLRHITVLEHAECPGWLNRTTPGMTKVFGTLQ